jgi:hypothetical protein
MEKFQRNYKAVFEIGERDENNRLIPREEIVIEPPFTLQLQTNTGINNTASNTGHFLFYNLSESVKRALWLDVWNFAGKYIYLRLYAGYGQNMPLIFAGFANQCMSFKDGGSTEFITELITNNNGMIQEYSYLNATFAQGTKLSDIIKIAIADSKHTSVGYITPDISPIKREQTFIGQPLDLIKRENGGFDIFITNGEINILGDRDVIPGEIQVISDKSGLLGSPTRSTNWVECDLVFEPQLRAGQAIAINSTTLPFLNRAYKIIQVEHKGIISPNVCGKLITTVTMAVIDDSEKVRELKKEVQSSYAPPPTQGKWTKPVKGILSSPFGKRKKPLPNASSNHAGIDIDCPVGSEVKAVASGKVMFKGFKDGYGYTVVINHGIIEGKEVKSWYAHLSEFKVNQYQPVNQGFVIGKSGGKKGAIGAGTSTGPHLHFGIQENQNFVDPTLYIGTY